MAFQLLRVMTFCVNLRLVAATPLFSTEESVDNESLLPRKFTQGASINDADYSTFTTEYAAGQTVANRVKQILDEDNFYYELFIPFSFQSEDQVNEYKDTFLTKFAALGADTSYTVTIERGASSDSNCQSSGGHVPYAYTTDKTITLCDAFFSQPATSSMSCANDGRVLDEFETGALTILHEFTHLSPAYFSLTESPTPPFTSDPAYGSTESAALAEREPAEAIVNPDNWMFVALGAYWSDKCGWQIDPDQPDTGAYDEPGQAPGCLPGNTNEWIVSTGASCGAKGAVKPSTSTDEGPGGCGIPETGGLSGVNVADCAVFPDNTTAAEITLQVTNGTKGYYTDYTVSVFTAPDCQGTSRNYSGPASSAPLTGGDYLYQTGCFDAPSGATWQSYHVWNTSAYKNLHG